MHLYRTSSPRIFAAADAYQRWADPWFPVIDAYAPPDRKVVVVSMLDYMADYAPKPLGFVQSLIISRQDMLCHTFAATAHNTIAFRKSLGHNDDGFHCYYPESHLSLLVVTPGLDQSKNDLCLMHEMGHAYNITYHHNWSESARGEILAEAFSYAVYAETMPNGDSAIKHANACITANVYIRRDKDELIHFPGNGPYLQAAQGTEADMLGMRASYYHLHSALREALGHTPKHTDELLEAVDKVIGRNAECDPVMPYAVHLRETQQHLLSHS